MPTKYKYGSVKSTRECLIGGIPMVSISAIVWLNDGGPDPVSSLDDRIVWAFVLPFPCADGYGGHMETMNDIAWVMHGHYERLAETGSELFGVVVK